MPQAKAQFYIEMPTPLSRRNSNAVAARSSLSGTRAEIPIKSLAKARSSTDVQNIEPDSSARDKVAKRKRSISDLANMSVSSMKKSRVSTKEKHSDKSGTGTSRLGKPFLAPQPASQPKWIPISTDVPYDEIMKRMHLREFLARFQPLTKFAQAHLDTLARLSTPTYHYIPRATLKAMLLALLDLAAADASSSLQKSYRAAIKHIRGAKGNLEVIWDSLAELRQNSLPGLPNPELPPNDVDDGSDVQNNTDDDEPAGRVTRRASKLARLSQPSAPPKDESLGFDIICGAQFLPVMIFLAENALQTPSVRNDIDFGLRTLASAAHKSHTAKVAEEKSRWNAQRQKFSTNLSTLEETKAREKEANGGKAARGNDSTLTKIKELKAKRKAAESKYQQTLRSLRVAYNLELRACAGRGTLLGSDNTGRQFFALNSPSKASHENGQWEYWSTFIACWGKESEGLQPRWYGFDDPAELRNLALVLDERTGLSEPSPAVGSAPLAKALLDFAEFLDYRSKN